MKLYFRKSAVWQYEKEWRIALDPGDPSLSKDHYAHTKAITGIIVGERVRYKKRVRRLAEEYGLELYTAKASASEYKIDIIKEGVSGDNVH